MLVDGFGRVHRDLRVSVTDRCDLRCTYCMPAEGLAWAPREDLLSFEEIRRVAHLLVTRHGFGSIRLTGGEPLLRRGIEVLVEMLAALGVDLSLTTNGVTLARHAGPLAEAGLDRVNVSLDTIDRARFEQITRRDALSSVLEGIDAALAAGLGPVKVNAVIVRGQNDDEIVALAELGRTRGVVVRFIEVMPLDASNRWTPGSVVTRDEIVAQVHAMHPLEEAAASERGSAPAESYRYRDGQGEIGVIPTVSDPFCSSCDRLRLTAEGQLRACLFALEETDLRTLMRDGADDDQLDAAISARVGSKWAGHGIQRVDFRRPVRTMSQIGG